MKSKLKLLQYMLKQRLLLPLTLWLPLISWGIVQLLLGVFGETSPLMSWLGYVLVLLMLGEPRDNWMALMYHQLYLRYGRVMPVAGAYLAAYWLSAIVPLSLLLWGIGISYGYDWLRWGAILGLTGLGVGVLRSTLNLLLAASGYGGILLPLLLLPLMLPLMLVGGVGVELEAARMGLTVSGWQEFTFYHCFFVLLGINLVIIVAAMWLLVAILAPTNAETSKL